MMDHAPTLAGRADPVAEVACPHCERPVDVSLPDPDVDPIVRSHVALFGDHTVVECTAGHTFWVYFC